MAQRFLKDTDYDDQLREELRAVLDDSFQSSKLKQAEQKALAQMRMYLSARYDADAIFSIPDPDAPDTRNAFIVMTLVDIAIYHIWSKERGKMPQVRSDRYQDALDWLKSVGNGEQITDLPGRESDNNPYLAQVYSLYRPNDNKY